jgi:signal peptidase I
MTTAKANVMNPGVCAAAPASREVASAYEADARQPSVLRELGGLLLKIGVIVGVAFLVFTFVYGLQRNTDPDMSPSVKDGDLVFFYRLDKDYAAGDLLVLSFRGRDQVRRVVAIEGDTVDITEDGLVVNGAIQQEAEISAVTEQYADGAPLPMTLGPGQVYVLGDNRENATDSRVYGAVNEEDTRGAVIALMRKRNL